MDISFDAFINAFGNGYKTMIDNHDGVTTRTDSSERMRKETFCRALLCEISNNEEIIIYKGGIVGTKGKRCMQVFQKLYNKEKSLEALHPFAASIIDTQSINKAKFKTFLEEYVKHFRIEHLCSNFQSLFKDVTEETIFDTITDAFEQFLFEAYNLPDNRTTKSSSKYLTENCDETDAVKNDSDITHTQIHEIETRTENQNHDSITIQQTTDRSVTADAQNDISSDLPDALSAAEKETIEHYCGLINSSLHSIKRQAEALERKQREINDLAFVLENTLPKNSHSRKIWHRQKVRVLWKPERKWKIPNPEWVKAKRRYIELQENESKKLIENADSNYNQLEKYCRKMTHQLINKQDLAPSIKAIYEIIQKIGDKKYKATTPETFSYSALSLLVSDYQNRYRRLLIFIQGK